MNGFIRFRPTDVLNLLVTRGASYLVAMIVLYFASLSLKGEAFIGFVFWWSLGLMFGALLLGGVSIASARSVVTSGDLVPPALVAQLRNRAVILVGIVAGVAALLAQCGYGEAVAALALGLALQANAAVGSVLRVLHSGRESFAVSLMLVVGTLVVSASLYAMDIAGVVPQFAGVVVVLAVAAVPGSIFVRRIVANRREQGHHVSSALSNSEFWRIAALFTAGSGFSFAIINIDFLVLKSMLTDRGLESAAGTKIYFERFVLPFWMIFANAASLGVIRDAPDRQSLQSVTFQLHLIRRHWFILGAGLAAAPIGYLIYFRVLKMSGDPLPASQLVIATVSYMLFAMWNGLLDILLLKRSAGRVLSTLIVVVCVYAVVHFAALWRMHSLGWVLSWLLTNSVILIMVARGNLRVSRPSRLQPSRPDED